MTTPGGAGTTHPLVLGSSASLIGSELFQIRRYRAPALRCAPVLRRYNSRTSSGEEGKGLGFRCGAPALYRALPRPDALSPLLNSPVFAAHNTRWRSPPTSASPSPIGPARCGLPNFALTEFSEVRQEFIGNSSLLASVGALINLRRGFSPPPFSERRRRPTPIT